LQVPLNDNNLMNGVLTNSSTINAEKQIHLS